jgi:hypothetical protein
VQEEVCIVLPIDNISTVPEGAFLEDKMDLVLSLLLKQLKQLSVFEEKINSLEKENKSFHSIVSNLSREVYTLKNAVNNSEQQSRGCSIRLLGLPPEEDETDLTDGRKALAHQDYDSLTLVPPKPRELYTRVCQRYRGLLQVGKAGPDKSKPPPIVIKL